MSDDSASDQTPCLSKTDVDALLSDCLGDQDVKRLSAHLEFCEKCQAHLEQRTSLNNIELGNSHQQEMWNALTRESDDHPNSVINRLADSGLLGRDSDSTTASVLPHDTNTEFRTVEIPRYVLPCLSIVGFQILKQIGRGGMGTVYAAHQQSLNRKVAIKVLRSSSSPEGRRRFQHETQAIGRLEHQHIVRAYDAGEINGRSYIVTELINGSDLARHVRENGPMDVGQACDFVRQAAMGLQAAHSAGLVHRDVKPSNLMTTEDGIVKVLDLGLAGVNTSVALPGAQSDEQTVMGSLDYMSPEQAQDFRNANVQSDIYSLGCSLYTLLHGRPPFADASTATAKLLAHAHGDRPDLSTSRDDVPLGLLALIRRMVDIDPTQRPESMATVAEQLVPFCDAKPVARQVVRIATFGDGDFRGRGSLWRFLMAAAMGGFILILGVITVRFKDGSTMRIETDRRVAEVTFEANDPSTTSNIDASKPVFADAAVSDEFSPKAVDPNSYPQLVRTLMGFEAPINAFCFGRSTSEAYSVCLGGRVVHWDLETGEPTEIYRFESQRVGGVAELTPDGKSLLFATDKGLSSLNLDTGKPSWTEPASANLWTKVIPGLDLLVHGRDRNLAIRKISDGTLVVRRIRRSSQFAPVFTNDTKLMTFCHRINGDVLLFGSFAKLDTNSIRTFSADNFHATDVAFAPDQKHLIAVGTTDTMIWEIDTGAVIHQHQTRNKRPQMFLEPIGASRLFLTLQGAIRDQLLVWDPITGSEHSTVAVPPTSRFVVSEDGQYVLTTDFMSDRNFLNRGLRLWKLEID